MKPTIEEILLTSEGLAEQMINVIIVEEDKKRTNSNYKFNYRGKMGEMCVAMALKLGIIKNNGWGFGPGVTAEFGTQEFWAQTAVDRINGDLWFVNPDTGFTEFIDVKNTEWVGLNSFNTFRKGKNDGYYLFNAWYRPTLEDLKNGKKAPIRYIMKINDDSREFFRKKLEDGTGYKLTKRSSGEEGYQILFKDIKAEWTVSWFDTNLYDYLMQSTWDKVDEKLKLRTINN